MRVRAKLTLRNEAMVAARAALGISQSELAERTGLYTQKIMQLEQFNYFRVTEDDVCAVAAVLGINTDEVMPIGFIGKKIKSDFDEVREIPSDRLLASGYKPQALLTASAQVQEEQVAEATAKVNYVLDTYLYPREAQIFRLRTGLHDGHKYTYEEIANMLPPSSQSRGMEPYQIGGARTRGIFRATRRRLQNLVDNSHQPQEAREIAEFILKAWPKEEGW